MIEVKEINLNNINKAKNFVKAATTYNGTVEIQAGRYTIDAKSILGVFSVDLTKPVKLFVSENESEEYEMFIEQCKALCII